MAYFLFERCFCRENELLRHPVMFNIGKKNESILLKSNTNLLYIFEGSLGMSLSACSALNAGVISREEEFRLALFIWT